MAATMSKTSWFKRNGGKDRVLDGEIGSTPTQQSSSSASPKISVFKAFRMGSGSLSSRSHSSSPSSSFTSTQSPSASSNPNPLPLAVSPSTSDPGSLLLLSQSNTTSTAQHPPSRTSGSFLHPVNAVRPSQDDPFANLSHGAGPTLTSASSSTPHVDFDVPSANHSSGSRRRPSVTTGSEATARRRVLSSPSASDVEASEAPSASSIVTGVINENSRISPSATGTTTTPAGSSSSPLSAAVYGSGIRYVQKITIVLNTVKIDGTD
jgi:hypothetical protein